METNSQTDTFSVSIPDNCPNLQEIGFRVDCRVTFLPIDQIFSKEKCTITSLKLSFDNCKASEYKENTWLTGITYRKLKKLNVEYENRHVMTTFVKMTVLFTEATLLEELEFHNIGQSDFYYMPLRLKGKIQMNQLTNLNLAMDFSNDFIQDLVQANPCL